MEHFYRIQQAVEYIERNLQEDLAVAEIAARAFFSPYHFQRLFQAISGYSVQEYIRRRRLTEAANLLKGSDQNILAVAVAYQYHSQEAFTRAFERSFGTTPAQYRKTAMDIPKLAKINLLDCHPKIEGELQMERPSIIVLPCIKVVGCVYRTPLKNEGYYREIPAFWVDFFRKGLGRRIPNRVAPDTVLSVAWNPDERRGMLNYLIGAQVDDFPLQVEPDFCHYEVPEGKYGEFKVNGPRQTVENTFRYIYGTWFPNSNYERGPGPDLKMVRVGRSTAARFTMSILIPLK